MALAFNVTIITISNVTQPEPKQFNLQLNQTSISAAITDISNRYLQFVVIFGISLVSVRCTTRIIYIHNYEREKRSFTSILPKRALLQARWFVYSPSTNCAVVAHMLGTSVPEHMRERKKKRVVIFRLYLIRKLVSANIVNCLL